jgi:chromate resistance exported protein
MRGAALGHHEGRCSFETALEAFGLTTDPALEEIGHIVHEADLADERYDAPAAAGLDVLIRGLTLTSGSDNDTLAITHRLFDGLYEHTLRQLMTGRPARLASSLPCCPCSMGGSVVTSERRGVLLRGHPVELHRVWVAKHQVKHPPAVDIETSNRSAAGRRSRNAPATPHAGPG